MTENTTTTTLDRTFGIEMEFTAAVNKEQVARALSDNGVPTVSEHYNHSTRRHWKIVTDSSVRADHDRFAMELVSPILEGEDGIAAIEKVCQILNRIGATVNSSCGVHVHIGAPDLDVEVFKKVYWNYAKYERAIDSFMAPSRRGSSNAYCRSINKPNETTNEIATRIAPARTIQEVIGSAVHNCRFYKLNAMSFGRQGTVEFRHHQGSVDGQKLTNWVRFCHAFVVKSTKSRPRKATSTTSQAGAWKPLQDFIADKSLTDFFKGRRDSFKRMERRAA